MSLIRAYWRLVFVLLVLVIVCIPSVSLYVFLKNPDTRDFHRFPPVPIAINGDRAYFFQGGYSLTMLDLENGRVISRGKQIRPGEETATVALRIIGNLIVTNECILDKRDGKPFAVVSSSRRTKPYLGGGYYVFAEQSNEGLLRAVDVNTGDIRVLARIGDHGDFLGTGESVFALEQHRYSTPAVLSLINLRTGDVEWNRPLGEDGGKLWLTPEAVYVLPFVPEREQVAGKSIAAFSLTGEPLPDIEPAQARAILLEAYFAVKDDWWGESEKRNAILAEKFGTEYPYTIWDGSLFPGGVVSGRIGIARRDKEWREWVAADSELPYEHRAIYLTPPDTTRSVWRHGRLSKDFDGLRASFL